MYVGRHAFNICCARLSSLKIYSAGSRKKKIFERVRDTINQRDQQMTSPRKWVWKEKSDNLPPQPSTTPTPRKTTLEVTTNGAD